MLCALQVEAVFIYGDAQTSDSDRSAVFVRLHDGALVKGKPAYGQQRQLRLHVSNPKTFEEKVREIEREMGIPVHHTLPIIYRGTK